MVPHSYASHLKLDNSVTLTTVNGTHIRTYGRKYVTIEVTPSKPRSWSFVVAEVPLPILGVDFFEHFGLLVDARHRKLLDGNNKPIALGSHTSSLAIRPLQPTSKADMPQSGIFNLVPKSHRSNKKLTCATRKVEHSNASTVAPVVSKSRRNRKHIVVQKGENKSKPVIVDTQQAQPTTTRSSANNNQSSKTSAATSTSPTEKPTTSAPKPVKNSGRSPTFSRTQPASTAKSSGVLEPQTVTAASPPSPYPRSALATSSTPRVTRSGRRVRFPDKLAEFFN